MSFRAFLSAGYRAWLTWQIEPHGVVSALVVAEKSALGIVDPHTETTGVPASDAKCMLAESMLIMTLSRAIASISSFKRHGAGHNGQ